MKLSPVPQNLIEWFALKAGVVPIPHAHTLISFVLSRAVLDAFTLNVFESMKDGDKSLKDISSSTNLDQRALKSLMNVLICTGYVDYKNPNYALTKMTRKWCLKDSDESLYNQQLFNEICWPWMEHMPEFLKTGKGLQYHETFNEREWELYQKGMESVAIGSSKTAVKMAPKMGNPTQMLDIGGSHGLYSEEFCKKYPSLNATILDLPGAVEKAEPLLRNRYKGSSIAYKKGNALTDDFGDKQYDLILISSLMHHFTAEQNKEVSKKIFHALKKDGYFIIQEFLRPEPSKNMDMVGSVLDLFFNLSSTSGNWSAEELINFQEGAAMKHIRIKKFLTVPGFAMVIGKKEMD